MLRALLAHWELKLVAIIVAATLWFWVATSEQSQIALAVPVEYVGLPRELVLAGGQRETMDVEVRAVRSVVARLGPETVRVRVDLTGVEQGESIVQVTPIDVQAPPGATVTRISPARMLLAVAQAATGNVKIVPQVRGTPAPGYAVQRVAVDPSSVTIRGPRSTIEARGEVSTLPIDVSGTRRTVSHSVGLMLPAATYLTREQTVRVTVEIAEDVMPQQQQGVREPPRKAAGR
jgi:YbbR domain-containing protein